MKRIVIAIAALSSLFLAACNTVKGVGQDVTKAGTTIEKSASR